MAKKAVIKITKLDTFIEEYIRNGGNATQAAMIVFDCKTRASAQSIGSQYVSKAKPLVRMFLEEKGYTLGYMLQIAVNKMEESKTPEWWDRIMYVGGFADFISKKSQDNANTVNIMQVQQNLLDRYVKGSFEPEQSNE